MTPSSQHIEEYIRIGTYNISIKSRVPDVCHWVRTLYRHFPSFDPSSEFIDFPIEIAEPSLLRRVVRPQVQFYFDGFTPFQPLPHSQAMPMLEWGLNWCFANHAQDYLHFHAAGLTKNDVFVIFPAPPGSGKSTLTAALMNNGWDLFSDEIVMINPKTLSAQALARPINLKNNSIDILATTFPDATFTTKFHDTSKGTVALMASTKSSVENLNKPKLPTHIIFPKYIKSSQLRVSPLLKSTAFTELITNSFNYHIQGKPGFDTTVRLIDTCECMTLEYSQFDDAFKFFDQLAN